MNETANAYLRTKVMTAPREELRLMLLDGALRFARMARDGLEQKDFEKIYEGFSNCRNIVLELGESIRPDPDPELAKNMKSVYTFIYGELVKASMNKDAEKLDKTIELLEYERETWAQFMEKLERERQAGAAAPADGPEPAPSDGHDRPSLSVQA